MNTKPLMNELTTLIMWAQKNAEDEILTLALDLIHELAVANYYRGFGNSKLEKRNEKKPRRTHRAA